MAELISYYISHGMVKLPGWIKKTACVYVHVKSETESSLFNTTDRQDRAVWNQTHTWHVLCIVGTYLIAIIIYMFMGIIFHAYHRCELHIGIYHFRLFITDMFLLFPVFSKFYHTRLHCVLLEWRLRTPRKFQETPLALWLHSLPKSLGCFSRFCECVTGQICIRESRTWFTKRKKKA